MVFIFQGAYALGLLLVGRLIDRLGTRLGYAFSMALWSLASMAQGMMSSLAGFGAARFALGFGEAGVFPASLKATAEWFPKKERALATGIFNAGSNLGAILTPLLVPWITVHWGWRWAFFSIGAVGFVWLALWLLIYRKPEDHPSCSAAELAYIRSDPAEPPVRISWLKLATYRQTWAFSLGKFIVDPIWWFFLFWIPDFLQRRHGLSLLADRLAHRRDLSNGRWRQHRWRLVLLLPHSSRQVRQCRPQVRHACLRDRRRAYHLRAQCRVHLGRRLSPRARCCRPSGILV